MCFIASKKLLLLILFNVFIVSCGQTGPLQLPDDPDRNRSNNHIEK